MPDREKVIRAINGCINIGDYCNDCDYDGCVFNHGSCEKDLLADALELLKEQEDLGTELTNAVELIHKKNERIEELLKEQEAVKPKVIGTNSFGHPAHACGKCGLLITESMNYCRECGKRIEWESR